MGTLATKDYDCLALPNSPVEFVIVGERNGKYKPILRSTNCGLDLLGYAASESYSRLAPDSDGQLNAARSQVARRKDDNSYDFQKMVLSAEHDDAYIATYERPINFMIFWYGTRLPKILDKELEFISKLNLPGIYQLYQINDSVGKEDLGYVEWHISPIIKILADANYDAAEVNRISIHRPNDFMENKYSNSTVASKQVLRFSGAATLAAIGAAVASILTMLGI